MNESHFSQLLQQQAKKYGDRAALYSRNDETEKWEPISWNELLSMVRHIALNLCHMGIKVQDAVGIFTQNKPEGLAVDFGLFWNRAYAIPMYATNTAAQVTYFVKDANISVLFVGEQYQHDVAVEVLKETDVLKRVIVFDDKTKLADDERIMYFKDFLAMESTKEDEDEVNARLASASDDDIATLMYTSGSTGESKGVILPHTCYQEAMRIHDLRLPFLTDDLTSLSFLPTSHIFERGWCYVCLHRGIAIYVNLRPSDVQKSLKEVRPNLMCSVPRFWEKVFIGIKDKISSYSPIMIAFVSWAVAVGHKYNIEHLKEEKKPSAWLRFRYKIADKFVFSKLKKVLGIENAVLLPAAGASLDENIAKFFRSIGIPICYGYGLTESTATVCCFDQTKYVFGSVGRIMPDLQVKIGENNEILLKGKTIFREYHNKPEENAKSFTEDGWFRTGDAGRIEGENLFLTERLKDLFKTSNGKYIAPQQIEMRLLADKYIDQVVVIGDKRNFVTAIITPAKHFIENYAKEHNISYKSPEELFKNSEIYAMLEERIKELQKGMPSYEHIKKFILTSRPFSLETGELTNTLKIKRAVVMEKFKKEIEKMYEKVEPKADKKESKESQESNNKKEK